MQQARRIQELLEYCPSIYDRKVHEVSLLKQLKFSPRDTKNKSISEFTLYCDPHFEVNAYANRIEDCRVYLPRLSVIEYKSFTLNCICVGQIIGIVEFDGILASMCC